MNGTEIIGTFGTTSNRLTFIALCITLAGLLMEIAGVFIILAGDYNKTRRFMEKIYEFSKVKDIKQTNNEVNEEKSRVRFDELDTEGEYESIVGSTDIDLKVLESIVFFGSESLEITDVGFTAIAENMDMETVRLTISAESLDHDLQLTHSEFRDRHQQTIRHLYYRYGSILVLIGFIFMMFATSLEIVSYFV